MWRSNPKFDQVVRDAWRQEVCGTSMFKVVWKLKMVKSVLKDFNRREFSNIAQRNDEAQKGLEELQYRL